MEAAQAHSCSLVTSCGCISHSTLPFLPPQHCSVAALPPPCLSCHPLPSFCISHSLRWSPFSVGHLLFGREGKGLAKKVRRLHELRGEKTWRIDKELSAHYMNQINYDLLYKMLSDLGRKKHISTRVIPSVSSDFRQNTYLVVLII